MSPKAGEPLRCGGRTAIPPELLSSEISTHIAVLEVSSHRCANRRRKLSVELSSLKLAKRPACEVRLAKARNAVCSDGIFVDPISKSSVPCALDNR
jgi:hypothetical protein